MVPSPWIEFHPGQIKRLKKFYDLRKAMRWSINEALGFLGSFWGEALEVCESGDVSGWTPEYLAELTSLQASVAERAWDALVPCGFIDDRAGRLLIHDWLDYVGLYLTRRYGSHHREKLVAIWALHERVYGEDEKKKPPGEREVNDIRSPGRTNGEPTSPHLTVKEEKKPPADCGKPVDNEALRQRSPPEGGTLLDRILEWHLRPVFQTQKPRAEVRDQLARTIAKHGHAVIEALFDRVANGPDPHPRRFWERVRELRQAISISQ